MHHKKVADKGTGKSACGGWRTVSAIEGVCGRLSVKPHIPVARSAKTQTDDQNLAKTTYRSLTEYIEDQSGEGSMRGEESTRNALACLR